MSDWKARNSSAAGQIDRRNFGEHEHLRRRLASARIDLVGEILKIPVEGVVEPPQRKQMSLEPKDSPHHVVRPQPAVNQRAAGAIANFEIVHRRQARHGLGVDGEAALPSLMTTRGDKRRPHVVGHPLVHHVAAAREREAGGFDEAVADDVAADEVAPVLLDVEQHGRRLTPYCCAPRSRWPPKIPRRPDSRARPGKC